MHSVNYHKPDIFVDKNVVCIGLGKTASDITHEACMVAKKVSLSLRHYQSVVARYPLDNEFTSDTFTIRSMYTLPKPLLNYLVYCRHRNLMTASSCEIIRELGEWTVLSGCMFNQFVTKNEVIMQDMASNKLYLNISGVERY